MSAKNLIIVTAVFGLALGLSACGRGDQSSLTNAADHVPGANAQGLKIATWGPDRTKAGVAFNVQPDGSAALWFRMNKSLNGADARVDFNGHPLTAAVQDDLVTARVSPAFYAAPGTYALHVSVKQDGSTVQSDDVKFVVE